MTELSAKITELFRLDVIDYDKAAFLMGKLAMFNLDGNQAHVEYVKSEIAKIGGVCNA